MDLFFTFERNCWGQQPCGPQLICKAESSAKYCQNLSRPWDVAEPPFLKDIKNKDPYFIADVNSHWESNLEIRRLKNIPLLDPKIPLVRLYAEPQFRFPLLNLTALWHSVSLRLTDLPDPLNGQRVPNQKLYSEVMKIT